MCERGRECVRKGEGEGEGVRGRERDKGFKLVWELVG